MTDDSKKKIDESWKEKVEKEKEREGLKKEGEFVPPVPDFNFFITTLALQASIFLGQVPNPATNKIETNLDQGKFIIDTLDMLKEKTQGNLMKEEKELLENLLYELKMQYVSKTKEGESK